MWEVRVEGREWEKEGEWVRAGKLVGDGGTEGM